MNYFFIGSDDQYYTKGTLAHFLDTRDVAYGEPTQSTLPVTINPFDLLKESVFKDRLSIIRIDCDELIDVPDLKNIDKILSFCVPVDNFLIVWVKLPVFEELVQTSSSETSSEPIPSIAGASDQHTITNQEVISATEI